MRKPICTIVIECSPKLIHSREEWGQFRMDLAHHINRMEGCDVKYFGWKDPSPEIYEADVLPFRHGDSGGNVSESDAVASEPDKDTLPWGTIVRKPHRGRATPPSEPEPSDG